MARLANDLLAVIDAVSDTDLENPAAEYRFEIRAAEDVLNSVEKNIQASKAPSPAALACRASRELFGDRVISPNSSEYQGAQRTNWSTTCWLPATCIIKLTNTVEVALAMRIVTYFQTPFAVRSGGHQANPGFSSIGAEGILLDLGLMNSVSIAADQVVASLGPGASWANVYEALEEKELCVVGGRVGEVGVGGLLLGGGMSHFSNQWGLACDHVKNFEVVLSDSRVVNANAEENIGLFGALKGGGPNFGIVTRYDLYTIREYRLWYTLKVYNATDAEQVMSAAVSTERAMEDDNRIGFFLMAKKDFLVAGMLYLGDAPEPKVFEVWSGITPVSVAIPETNGTQLSLSRALSMAGEAMWEIGAVTVRPDPELYVELYRVVQNVKSPASCSYGFTFQPIGASAAQRGNTLGGNCGDVPAEYQSWLAISAQWTDSADDELARSGMHNFISSLRATAKSRGLLLDYEFQNDASYIQSPLKTLRKETLDFLWETSRKYDPNGVFQQLQNGGFLLSKA